MAAVRSQELTRRGGSQRARGLAWGICALTFALAAVSVPFFVLGWGTPTPSGIASQEVTVVFAIAWLPFPFVGALIASRHPRNPIGWLLCAAGAFTYASIFSWTYALYAVLTEPGSLPGGKLAAWFASWSFAPGVGLIVLVVLLFPSGQLLSPRWRVVGWMTAAGTLVMSVSFAIREGPLDEPFESVTNPLGVTGAEFLVPLGGLLLTLGATFSAASLVLRLRRTSGDERQRIKWVAYAGAVMAASLFAFGATFPTDGLAKDITSLIWPLGIMAMPVAVGIAILRHRLYDIDVVINRTLVYATLTASLALVYAASVLLLEVLSRPFTQGSGVAIALSTLAAAALFRPLRARIQDAVDRRFYRSKYDTAVTLEAFSARLRDEIDLETLSRELVGVARRTMKPSHASLRFREGGPSGSEIASDDPIVTYFERNTGAADVRVLELESPALEEMRAARAELAVPLISGRLIGVLELGRRRSDQDYSGEDRRLLENLALRAAPALRLALVVREQQAEVRARERLVQELRLAQVIQQNFLPKELPSLPGWKIAVYYRPAREVGGDFYDFVELPDGHMGFFVGDVTDKGVPAAMVMAAARGLLRAVAQRLGTPGEVLERVNEQLVPDIPAKMFVTCLYGILNVATGELRYANAGHNVPYVRANGRVSELRATGMPLGLMEGMTYEEKEATIDRGQVVLLHSDGLAEAHSREGELFGFGRVANTCAGCRQGNELIDRLLSELRGFTGAGWEQEDDITLVTLERTATNEEAETDTLLAAFEVASEPGNERIAIAKVEEVVTTLGLVERRLERLKTAVGEATMNAIEHGNRNQPDVPVTVRVLASTDTVRVRITDRGGGRPIPDSEAPDLDAKLAGAQTPRGWGLFLIEKMVDEVAVTTEEDDHTVELVVHLAGDDDERE